MNAKERLELAQLLDQWESGALDAAGRERCRELSEMERAARWQAAVPPSDPFEHFYRERRLGDSRPQFTGLPICASPRCRRTFTPTSLGQELCHECRVPTVPGVAVETPKDEQKVLKMRRAR